MNDLTAAQLAKIENQLLALQSQLQMLAESSSEASATVELDQARTGRLTRMDALQAQAMSVASGRRRAQRLSQIAAALQRLHDGDFGYCLDCGEPINPRRLAIDPAATDCIHCAELKEAARR